MEEQIFLLLNSALDYGLTEFDFWEMTPAEINRYAESRNRVRKMEAQEKATYDYILANLISRGVAITMGSKQSFPKISEAYPNIFDDLEKEQEAKIKEQQTNLSVLRFKQFAQFHNNKLKNKEVLTANE